MRIGHAGDVEARVLHAGVDSDPLVGAASSIRSTGVANAGGSVYNIFAGRRTNSQTVTFNGIPLGFVDTRGKPRLRSAYNSIKAANGGVYSGQPVTASITKTYRTERSSRELAFSWASRLATN